MTTYNLNINLYDLVLLITASAGVTLILLLYFVANTYRTANRWLAAALLISICGLNSLYQDWPHLQIGVSLASGPCFYIYVLLLLKLENRLRWPIICHFLPLLLELSLNSFTLVYTIIQFVQIISVSFYAYKSFHLISNKNTEVKFIGGDRYRSEWRWLKELVSAFVILSFFRVSYLNFPSIHLIYLSASLLILYIASKAFLKSTNKTSINLPIFIQPVRAVLKERASWLKQAVKVKRYYQDPELNLSTLADNLGLQPHELSRILNSVLKKNFNDFINEYRVAEVCIRLGNPAYDHLTLLGIAYDAGFNSKTTFHRIFRQFTGKSPAEYKSSIKKDGPNYDQELQTQKSSIILNRITSTNHQQGRGMLTS